MARTSPSNFSWIDKVVNIALSVITAIVIIVLFISDIRNNTRTNAVEIQNLKDNFSEFKTDFKDFKDNVRDDLKEVNTDIKHARELIEKKQNHD